VAQEYCASVLRDCRKLLTNLDIYKTVLRDEPPALQHVAASFT
jgi:hypothetical protein